MKKSAGTTANRKLLDRLPPDPSLGSLLGILATTYELQPEFFETDFLPTLFGLGAWDDKNWSSRIALEKRLSELHATTVLTAARAYRGRPRSLRIEVEPVHNKSGGALHAKILIAVYTDAIRLVFGSANLTEPGYRKNREVAAVITASATRPSDAQLVRDALQGLRRHLLPHMTPASLELSASADTQLAQWAGPPSEREQWFVFGGEPEPLWRQFLNRWPAHEPVEQITIVSPFWSDDPEQHPLTQFISELSTRQSLSSNAGLRLLTEGFPGQPGTWKPMLPESFAAFDARTLGVTAQAWAVDPRVPPEEVELEGFQGTRNLHAKIVLLEGERTLLAYFGSANFTRRGWGFLANPTAANIEAGLIVRRSAKHRAALSQLIPATIGDPVPLEGAAAGRIAPPEASPGLPPWPDFLRDVLLTPSATEPDALELLVTVDPANVEGSWKIAHVPGASEEQVSPPPLLAYDRSPATASEFRTSLDETQLERLLRDQEVHVSWWDCNAGRAFPLNVDADARTALPIAPGSGQPQERQLLAYYQGRITWEDLFPDPQGEDSNAGDRMPENELHSGVDTSQIQSYIVREFVEALKGITDDLKAAAQATEPCMRPALLGPVSPVALARLIQQAALAGQRTATAAGFQLVELIACLQAARAFPGSEGLRDKWHALLDEAVKEIESGFEELRQRFADELSGSFQKYVSTVLGHTHAKDGSQC